MYRLVFVVPLGLAMGLLEGCGPGRGDVRGQVTFQGKVVSRGSVVMVGDDRRPLVGRIESDGTYSLKGVPAGVVRIGVVSPDPAAAAYAIRRAPQNRKGPADLKAKFGAQVAQSDETGAAANKARGKWFPLPKAYEDPDASGLTTEVRRGENRFDIELR